MGVQGILVPAVVVGEEAVVGGGRKLSRSQPLNLTRNWTTIMLCKHEWITLAPSLLAELLANIQLNSFTKI